MGITECEECCRNLQSAVFDKSVRMYVCMYVCMYVHYNGILASLRVNSLSCNVLRICELSRVAMYVCICMYAAMYLTTSPSLHCACRGLR